uniref:COP9 signalosome subunit 8 n=1 Tax=Phocoena sinus TaxID=42100 RepID=A0A8C9B7D2_PHOSS
MPVAVMAESSFSFRKLLDQCENQELEAPGGIATPPVYGQLLALYLLYNDICHPEASLRPGLSGIYLHHRRRFRSLCWTSRGRGCERYPRTRMAGRLRHEDGHAQKARACPRSTHPQ